MFCGKFSFTLSSTAFSFSMAEAVKEYSFPDSSAIEINGVITFVFTGYEKKTAMLEAALSGTSSLSMYLPSFISLYPGTTDSILSSSVLNENSVCPVIFSPSFEVRFLFTVTLYSLWGMISSSLSKLKRLVPYQRKTPFSSGSILNTSD